VRVDDAGTYTGGLMVTDEHGLPLDFRYTDPVTPTRLQRALYGGVLDRYLRTEVVLRTLVGALERRPTLILTEDEAMLDAEAAGVPVALVSPANVAPIGVPGTRQDDPSGAIVLQVADDESPLRLRVDPGDGPTRDRVAEDLVRLGRGMQVREPAERVHQALDLIAAGEAD
jgi:hypothetical protein